MLALVSTGHHAAVDSRSKMIPAAWAAPIDLWCATMRAQGLTPDTVYLRRAHVAQLARGVDAGPDTVTLDDLLVWLGSLSWSRETRRTHRSSYRRFFTYLGRHDIVEGLPRVKPSPPMPMPIPEHVLQAGLRTGDERARLALRLAAECGMRRAEIAQVHASDLGVVRDGATLLVHGKGEKPRLIPIADGLAAVLRLRCGGGWLFPGEYRGTGHVSPAWIGKLATRALPPPWTLHKLRHRFATVTHDATGDLVVVQQLLGHASLATTQLYVAANHDRMRAAVLAAAA